MISGDIERREELLELAGDLAKRLRSIEVPYLANRAIASHGVSASALSHATSYLARTRDLEAFRGFLARFDQLDEISAQNPENPKADHRVVRDELQALLEEHPDLSADEFFYLTSWTRRLLPRKNGNGGRGETGGHGPRRPRKDPAKRRPSSASFKGGQIADALQRALDSSNQPEKDRREPPPGGRRR